LVKLDVENTSNQLAYAVRAVYAVDDLGTVHAPLSEIDPQWPVAPRPVLAEAPLSAGAKRRVRYVYRIPARRSISALDLPALSAIYGSRRLELPAGKFVPTAD
jgi:hypothetical protein